MAVHDAEAFQPIQTINFELQVKLFGYRYFDIAAGFVVKKEGFIRSHNRLTTRVRSLCEPDTIFSHNLLIKRFLLAQAIHVSRFLL